MNLTDRLDRGWGFIAISNKTGDEVVCKRFHYFVGDESLCGKYNIKRYNSDGSRQFVLLDSVLSNERCVECERRRLQSNLKVELFSEGDAV